MYTARFEDEWNRWFNRLDNSIQVRIWKKVQQIKAGLPGRHLERNLPYFVEEVDQYRICYKSDDIAMVRRFYFVGTHKEYLKWVGQQEIRPSD